MNKLWSTLPEELKTNPFFQYSEENNFVPLWDKITVADAEAALLYSFINMAGEVNRIVENKNKPTFKNTVEPLEEAFGLVGYFYRIFFTLTPTDKNEEKLRRQLEITIGKLCNSSFINTFNNVFLFEKFAELCKPETVAKWSAEEQAIGGMYFNGFFESGIKLSPEKRKAHYQMQQRIFNLGNVIQKKMRDAGEHMMLFVSDPLSLEGIPQDVIDQAAKEAAEIGQPEKWAFLANRVIYEALMVTAKDRQLRKDMWNLYHKHRMVGPFRTEKNILELMKLTYDAAYLKSRKTPAAEIIKYNMAKTPRTVESFLRKLRDASMPVALQEMEVLKEFAKNNLGIRKLQPWDVSHVEELVKKCVFGFDDQDLRGYFELEHVLEKMIFPHLKRQLGATFVASDAYPAFHKDVRNYDVYDNKGKHMGVVLLDLYDRSGKMAGIAWSMSVLPQGMFEGKIRRPVNKIDMKLTKPSDGQPTLLTHMDVTTLKHELGHTLHDLKSACKYSSRSGTGVDTDFVEFPSQYQEFVAYEPEFLRKARHHLTGKPLPEDTLEKLSQSRKFMAGRSVLERSMRGWLDLQWHNKNPHGYTTIKAFEDDVLKSFRQPGMEYPVYSPAFSYTFGGGYDSAFYSYQWSEVMSADLIEKSRKLGMYEPGLKTRFAKTLAVGGVVDETENYKKLAGRTPTLNPMLRGTGLLGKPFNYAAALEQQPKPANDAGIAPDAPQVLKVA